MSASRLRTPVDCLFYWVKQRPERGERPRQAIELDSRSQRYFVQARGHSLTKEFKLVFRSSLEIPQFVYRADFEVARKFVKLFTNCFELMTSISGGRGHSNSSLNLSFLFEHESLALDAP